ncbi:MAG: Crp/Fnr family transcriptional regulator [Rhodocyclales bacterium]|nr:Crp/Fnr family transcriptional regulator [Rhodocyclales bacterium]
MSHPVLNIPQMLARQPLFRELSPAQIERIAADTREKRLTKGATLFQKGDDAHGFYFVIFGQIKLALSSAEGNEKVVEIIGPQQSFGEAVMFMNRPYPVFAEALADSLLLYVARATVFELLETDATFARALLAGLSRRLHSLIADVESYSMRSSLQRVIGYLLQLGDAEDPAAAMALTLPTSKQVVASRLNLTPETFSRVLHDLTEAGLIDVQGKQITVHDLQRLREFDY